ncbi:UbiA family prenyltransferase [Fimbriiglobus ruber]|nr:UbiA family prenyltransferase [Fimbriiglobus ruber]
MRRSALEHNLATAAAGGHAAINDRLALLEREWSAGRMTKAVTGVFILAGLVAALVVNPWFAVIPAAGGLILAQYFFGRRSWLGELFGALGYRSGTEIDRERLALLALRGDFCNLPTVHHVEDPDAIARLEGEGGIVFEPDEAKLAPMDAVKVVVEATHK